MTGFVPERFALACNGFQLPLQPTATAGEFVCGVRYRAWQPPRCLHPTIAVHTPLVFDLVDTSARRAIGGCTYHVAHPGGRSYDTFPVNSNEAEARRRTIRRDGHTPGSARPVRQRTPSSRRRQTLATGGLGFEHSIGGRQT